MESIPDTAKKCRYCWEWVTEKVDVFDENKKKRAKKVDVDIDDEELDDDIDDEELDDDIDDEDVDDEENSVVSKSHKKENIKRWNNSKKNDKAKTMAIIWIVLLFISLWILRSFFFWVLFLIVWIFLIVPFYNDWISKK